MDENASKAVFIGASVLVAIITITLILNFYRSAKEVGDVANRYDISTSDKYVNEIVRKTEISGLELRYLLNYYAESDEVEVKVWQEFEGTEQYLSLDSILNDYWSSENQQKLEDIIRANYKYDVEIQKAGNVTIIAKNKF